KGTIEEESDKACGSVVAARGLAFTASKGFEGEVTGVGVQVGLQFQKALVDTTEFFGAEVLVVDGVADALDLCECEMPDCGEQMPVGEVSVVEIGCGVTTEKKATECWDR